MTEKPVLNAASLLDLKAELLRKQELLKEARLKRGIYRDFTGSKLKKPETEPKVKKKVKVEKVPELSQQEELALQKSRAMLERKAILYDKLSRGDIVPDDEQSEHFLVDFQNKVPDSYQPHEQESFKSESKLNSVENQGPQKTNVKYSNFVPAEVASSKIVDRESEEDNTSGAVHYQNVQFKEVREHGVGYFSFSMDEDERKKQLDALNALRHRTEDQQKALLKKKRKKQALLKSRLAKVRLRKNIPSKESEEEEEYEEESNDEEEDIEKHVEDSSLASQPVVAEEPKPVKVRPWDKGKDFSDLLPERKTKPNVVNQWVENRRAERVADFAPPELYARTMNRAYQTQRFSASLNSETIYKAEEEKEQTANEGRSSSVEDIISERISQIRRQL